MSQNKHKTPKPLLIPVDRGFTSIPFQFPTNTLVKSVAGSWSESSSMNREDPILQFTRGEQKVITFEAMLFAETSKDDIKTTLDKLEAAVQRDPQLKRPPIWIFTWGSVFQVQCIVASIGGVKYDALRPDGTLRAATCNITLKRYEFFDVERTDPNAPPRNTFYRVAQENDTWETLAARHYGDAQLGELLRRLNPSQPSPTVGSTVLLPDKEKLTNVSISPDSIPLARTEKAIELKRDTFTLRGGARYSTVKQ